MYNGMKVYLSDPSTYVWANSNDYYWFKFFFNGAKINRGNKRIEDFITP